jgi:hypothetical protein
MVSSCVPCLEKNIKKIFEKIKKLQKTTSGGKIGKRRKKLHELLVACSLSSIYGLLFHLFVLRLGTHLI